MDIRTYFSIIICFWSILLRQGKNITIISMSEETAVGLGVNVPRCKILVCLAALLLAGMAVSIVGSIDLLV
ncbi:MAG: iron chelate uptake ABC transporter family permease subunit [Thomasclavelia ramosa]